MFSLNRNRKIRVPLNHFQPHNFLNPLSSENRKLSKSHLKVCLIVRYLKILANPQKETIQIINLESNWKVSDQLKRINTKILVSDYILEK